MIAHPISTGASIGVVIASLFVMARCNLISWARFGQITAALLLVVVGVSSGAVAEVPHG